MHTPKEKVLLHQEEETLLITLCAKTIAAPKRHPGRPGRLETDPLEIESWAPGLRLKEEWFFNQSIDINKMSLYVRLMFKVMGSFKIAQKAHRVLYFTS